MNSTDIIAHVLEVEGGYSDNPLDQGGKTNYGITQSTWDGYRRNVLKGSGPASVGSITQKDAMRFYDQWAKDYGLVGLLPDQFFTLYDFTVNSGYNALRAVRRNFIPLAAPYGIAPEGDLGWPSEKLQPLTSAERDFLNSVDGTTFRFLMLCVRTVYLWGLVKYWFEKHPAGSSCRNWSSADAKSTACAKPGIHPSLYRGLMNRILHPSLLGGAMPTSKYLVSALAKSMAKNAKKYDCPYLDPLKDSFLAGYPYKDEVKMGVPILT